MSRWGRFCLGHFYPNLGLRKINVRDTLNDSNEKRDRPSKRGCFFLIV